MNWDLSGPRSYVDIIPPNPTFNANPYERPSYWGTPHPDARLKPGILRHHYSTDQLRGSAQHPGAPPLHGPGHVHANNTVPSQRVPLLRTTSLPPVDPSKQLTSTPELHQSTQSPASSHNTPVVPQAGFSPQPSMPIPQQGPRSFSTNIDMADPRRNYGQQRPLMGPPETPSRAMQASPNMFPTLQFSPDLFSAQSMGPMTAPIYPQQRLFWDQSPVQQENQHIHHQFQNPYQDSFDASFHSSSTVVPNYSPAVSQDSNFDLPPQPSPSGPFLDTTAFPMPFQTSPRPPPPVVENPMQFLSSPARRFGGTDAPAIASFRRPPREMPAYHHQIEESRRERELEKKRNKTAAKRADADLIMSSVRRALSPSKLNRPSLKRSQTHSGINTGNQLRRKSSKLTLNDSTSVSSAASAESGRNGRSSPLKSVRQFSSSSVSNSRASKSRTAISLAIDEHGVAKTVLQDLQESDDDMDVDEDAQSVISSADDEDFNVIRSATTSFAFDDDDTDSHFSQPPRAILNRQIDGRRSVTGGPQIVRSIRRGTANSDMSNPAQVAKGDAQKALRAIIEDRTRSVSAQGGYSSSRQSDSSVQFHSSPPIQQNQFGDFNPSPTTITDPDLATPNTDQETYGSLGATRCVCSSISPNGSAMIQCNSCSHWLHAHCVGVDKRRLSDIYICLYCDQTPVRNPSNRGSIRSSMRNTGNSASPLAHKSLRPNRGR